MYQINLLLYCSFTQALTFSYYFSFYSWTRKFRIYFFVKCHFLRLIRELSTKIPPIFHWFVHNFLIIIDIKFILHALFSFATLNGLCRYLMILFCFWYPLLFTLIRLNRLYFSLESFFKHTYIRTIFYANTHSIFGCHFREKCIFSSSLFTNLFTIKIHSTELPFRMNSSLIHYGEN